MTMWHSLLNMIVTSLFAGLVVAMKALILKVLFTSKNLNDILLKYKRAVYIILLFLIFSIPIAFSLLKGERFLVVLAAYMRELLISIVIVVTFWATWIAIDDPIAVKQAVLINLLRLLLRIWEKVPSASIQTTVQTRLEDVIGERLLNASLKASRLIYIPGRYPMVCDEQSPSEYSRIWPISSGLSEMVQNRFDSYGEEEISLKRDLDELRTQPVSIT